MQGIILLVPLLVIAISVPLILGKVPRNRWYGFRTPKTLSSDAVWYEANRIGGKYLCVAGLIQLVAFAIGFSLWSADTIAYESLLATLPLLIAIVFWFLAVRHIRPASQGSQRKFKFRKI
jgi:uncharacterized membrane protein